MRPGPTNRRSGARPAPRSALTGSTGTPGARSASCRATASGSAARSALVSTTSGCAPDSCARESSRSIRAASGSGCTGSTTAAASRLAASTWPLASLPAVRRTSAVRRGSTASTVTGPSGQVDSSTQSPAQGSAVRSRAAAASTAPPRLARTGPCGLSTVQTPRSTRATRPGRWPARRSRWAAQPASQPRAVRSRVMVSSSVSRDAWRSTRAATGMHTTSSPTPGAALATTRTGRPRSSAPTVGAAPTRRKRFPRRRALPGPARVEP